MPAIPLGMYQATDPMLEIVDSITEDARLGKFHKDEAGVITDMVSFYTLPSTVMNQKTYTQLKAAYSFYNVCTATPFTTLMRDCLISARDVSNIAFTAASYYITLAYYILFVVILCSSYLEFHVRTLMIF
ncbi:unnamed protein product [Protopolystoma xenopodis]|uniref:Glycylpeptide N-tetradecanoyltransferase n=1 Tax=Protopolystoma xenopodis TaxID=117903 RepID=A0A448WKU7_9PLAT|nr:unnamed protein product [Protopolystoma xenopodis]